MSFLITGANGIVGKVLCQRLQQQGEDYLAVSRQAKKNQLQWDLNKSLLAEQLPATLHTVIHCAPLWLLPGQLEVLQQSGVKRIIAFSSTSVLSKRHSSSAQEQQLVALLSLAESSIGDFSQQQDSFETKVTIFRPSMIYGYALDQNISHLARFIKRYRLMFLVGKAKGLRQPVHVDDLVDACFKVLASEKDIAPVYNLAGAEVLSYRAMVERVFLAYNLKVRFFSIPLSLYRAGLWLAAKTGRFAYTANMADRMNQDLNYDSSNAQADFGYSPQKFLQQAERDLP